MLNFLKIKINHSELESLSELLFSSAYFWRDTFGEMGVCYTYTVLQKMSCGFLWNTDCKIPCLSYLRYKTEMMRVCFCSKQTSSTDVWTQKADCILPWQCLDCLHGYCLHSQFTTGNTILNCYSRLIYLQKMPLRSCISEQEDVFDTSTLFSL